MNLQNIEDSIDNLLSEELFSALTYEEQVELFELMKQKEEYEKFNQFNKYFTTRDEYKKHWEFFDAGKDSKFRLFMAANRIGKTTGAAYELTCHLTGEYPDNWDGHKFEFTSDWWVCCVDSNVIRDVIQPLLLGKIGEFGTGMIPKRFLDFDTLKDAKKADTPITHFRVKHKCGGFSQVTFKSYDSGREAFQGSARSIWLDEEPPLGIFTECAMRTATADNILMMTFTPLKGISETILNFLEGSQFTEGKVGLGKHVTMASWDDVPHLTDQDKAILLQSIPPYQRDSRTKGIPQLGSGAIYPVPESEYLVERFEIPKHWPRLMGLDVGWNRTAAIWLAKDPNTNIFYAYHEYYKGEAEPSIHAVALKAPGNWIPCVIDTAARGRSQIDGQKLMDMYRGLGLNLHDADKAVETGLYTVWELLSTGRIKVFDHLKNFKDEIRMYRRDEKGKVIKEKDHLMDAFRYAIMSRDIARVNIPRNKEFTGLPTPNQPFV